MEHIAISVIVPIYNTKPYLAECIESILAQKINVPIEVLLIDDGSTDGCGEVCDKYAARDERVRVIHQENQGLSAARNAGIDAAKGRYYSFIDSDDVVLPRFLQTLYDACEEHDAYMSLCSVEDVQEDGKSCDPAYFTRPTQEGVFCGKDLLNEFYTPYGTVYTVAWNKMYRAEVWKLLHYPEGRLHEDDFVAHRLFWRCDKVVCIDKPLYHYRLRNGSICRTNIRPEAFDAVDGLADRYRFYVENHADRAVIDAAYAACWRRYLFLCAKVRQYPTPELVKAISKEQVVMQGLISYLPNCRNMKMTEKLSAARRAAEGWQHTKMLYSNRPGGHRRYWPMVFLERCAGIAAPYDPWYQKVQLSLALELPPPDLIVAEGGNLTQCSAISRMFGRKRCLAHLHGQTTCTPVMDDIYGGVLALSDFIREDYLQSSTLDPQRAYILHNCIDTARFCPGPASKTLRAQLGFTDEDFVVLYCGRLDPDKGIHKLMEAIAALHEPHIKLLIVGSPFFARTQQSAFQRKLEQQAKSLGNRVQFTGYIPNEDLPDYYRLADLCCVPTLVEEAAGLVAVEAMACGRPVLATRSGGMPEYLAGSQAVLVERGDTVTDQLAWSIRMLYEHPALCTEMGAAGAARGREFSTAHYYEEFVRIVRDVTENGGAQ